MYKHADAEPCFLFEVTLNNYGRPSCGSLVWEGHQGLGTPSWLSPHIPEQLLPSGENSRAICFRLQLLAPKLREAELSRSFGALFVGFPYLR